MMEIRACDAGDLEVLNREWPSNDVWEGHMRRQLTGEATFLVAWDGDEPVGVGMLQWKECAGEKAHAALPGAVEVNHLQVRESRRGQGIGTALVAAFEELARGRGITQMVLAVDADNPAARALYLRLGYEATGVVDTYTYSYRDDDGVELQATEASEALVKEL